jgi:hypothetical protein
VKLEEEKREKAKVNPTEMCKGDESFGEWDGEGMLTKMKDGTEVRRRS